MWKKRVFQKKWKFGTAFRAKNFIFFVWFFSKIFFSKYFLLTYGIKFLQKNEKKWKKWKFCKKFTYAIQATFDPEIHFFAKNLQKSPKFVKIGQLWPMHWPVWLPCNVDGYSGIYACNIDRMVTDATLPYALTG